MHVAGLCGGFWDLGELMIFLRGIVGAYGGGQRGGRAKASARTKAKARAKANAKTKTNAGPSTHHPQTEVRLGPRSLRMTASYQNDRRVGVVKEEEGKMQR
jgi:hypothetical protein